MKHTTYQSSKLQILFNFKFLAVVILLLCSLSQKEAQSQNGVKNMGANKTGSSARLDLYLTLRDKSYKMTGKKIVADVWVSERVALQARMSDGSSLIDPVWFVHGNAFYSYVQGNTETHPKPLDSFLLEQKTVSFIWRDRGTNLKVSFKAKAGGKNVSGSVNFPRVRKPQVELPSYTDGVHWEESTGLQIGHIGGPTRNPTIGRPTAPPAGVVAVAHKIGDWPAGAMLRFTQLVNRFDISEYNANLISGRKSNMTGLDGAPAYQATFYVADPNSAGAVDFGMGDAPHTGYRANDKDHRIRLDAEFTTWLMFKTNDLNSQWIPLRSFFWKGGGQADRIFAGNSSSSWAVSGQYAQSFPSAETTVFPEWEHLSPVNVASEWKNF